MTSVETSSRRARLMCLGEHRHWLNFFWNERQELCLSIKEGVKEFYVQVIDQPQEKTEKGQQEWQILAETRVEYKLQLASLLFREPFFFVQCLPWFLKQPARPIPVRCWKFFDFSPSKDSSMCKSPNRWSLFFPLLRPWAWSLPTKFSSEQGLGRTVSAGCWGQSESY